MGVLLLLRHGQASLGAANYDQLSEVGRRQAELTARRLARSDLRVDHLLCGSLVRQRDTALALLQALGRDPADLVPDPRLDEYDHVGVLAMHTSTVSFSTATSPDANREVQPALDEAIARWMAAPTGHPATGYAESHQAFIGRVLAAVTELAARAGTTVATTSGGVIAVAAAHLLGLRTEQWPALARLTVNGSITKLITGRTGTNVLTFNDHAHLEEDRSLITYR
jgi:broad specificity phosphatase PhoE